ncbi:WXG100 family type VII secretion target [Streptomyces sp. F63]|uniref:WXG100 family type VII secretion target n=1 Tax=Streptomyces sp. F63 TaxID=2824887 RepID=UPI001B398E9D|nr:WXG100 family type VII secretion target [Streptomyces sp. F63]MBQ0984370.1 WXG100 family type VII secretion target [Streptomyces sp. F63]
MGSNNGDIMLVTYSSLEEAAKSIDMSARRVDEALEALQKKIRSVSNTFEGEAKTAADTAHAKWDKETRVIQEALKSIAKAVREAGPTYQAGDRKAASHF